MMKKETKEVKKLVEALIWCSGSGDFLPEGKARKGWLKICQPLIKKYIKSKKTNRGTTI